MQAYTVQRTGMVLAGALAGLALYALSDWGRTGMIGPRAALFLIAALGAAAAAFLAAIGPLGAARAAAVGLGAGLVPAGLLTWASLRFDTVGAFLDQPLHVLAALAMAGVATPYLMTVAEGRGWRDYPTLFATAWNLVVRYAAALVFVAVVWAAIVLSDRLLRLVEIRALGDFIALDPVPWAITGAGLGLALAVVTELSDLVAPDLVLRFLRLLAPPLLAVLALFVLAFAATGFSGRFATQSPTALLLAMLAGAATLVNAAIDRSDAEAAEAPAIRLSAQGLALILPLLAALAAWTLWQRVDAFGWTPGRVAGAVVSGLGLAYGLAYGVAALSGGGWRGRIRAANVWLGLALVAVCGLWLSPLLNAEAISARTQLARFDAGRTPVDRLDVAALTDLGRAGEAAIAALSERAAEPGQSALGDRIARARQAVAIRTEDPAALRAELAAALPLRPDTAATAALRDRLLAGVSVDLLPTWVGGCAERLPDGRPACVLLAADFLTQHAGDEVLILYRDVWSQSLRMEAWALDGRTPVWLNVADLSEGGGDLGLIAEIQDGAAQIGPAPIAALIGRSGAVAVLP